MKILLINPARLIRVGNIWQKINPELPPLGLGYVASYLEKQGIQVKILDLGVENINHLDLQNTVKGMRPDLVGITANTILIKNAIEIAGVIKAALPEAKIVMGGVHPTIFPDEVLSDPSVDYVVRNEGEITFAELAGGKPVSEIQGISYKIGDRHIHNPPRPFMENLDDMPHPAYHLLPMAKYHPSVGNYKRLPAASIITSRGCPGRCTFCYTGGHGKRIRFRSAENIIDEIQLLIRDYGIKEISFYDDTFTANKENVRRFCRLIKQENIDITWTCMSRIDFVDEETLSLMKIAGCHQIGYGIESSDEGILKNIKKRISLSDVPKVIKLTQKCGIEARAMFIFGSPGETEQTMKNTLDFAIKLRPDLVVFNVTTPYPGTEMFAWAKEKGYLNTTDWSKCDLSQSVMNLPGLEPKVIERFYLMAYRRFYLRPSFLLKRLFKLRSPLDFKNNMKAFFFMLKK